MILFVFSYMTAIDAYVLLCFVVAFAVIVWQSFNALAAAPIDAPENFGMLPEEPFFTQVNIYTYIDFFTSISISISIYLYLSLYIYISRWLPRQSTRHRVSACRPRNPSSRRLTYIHTYTSIHLYIYLYLYLYLYLSI